MKSGSKKQNHQFSIVILRITNALTSFHLLFWSFFIILKFLVLAWTFVVLASRGKKKKAIKSKLDNLTLQGCLFSMVSKHLSFFVYNLYKIGGRIKCESILLHCHDLSGPSKFPFVIRAIPTSTSLPSSATFSYFTPTII